MQDQLTEAGGQYPDVGARISKAFSLYSAYFMAFVTISIVTLPFSILGSLPVVGLILAIPGAIVSGIVDAALITAAGQSVVGVAPTPGPDLSGAWNKFGRLFELFWRTAGTVILLAITIIGIPWAIRVAVRWSFGLQGVMLHDLDARSAISESCRLVEGNWWRTFGNYLLIGLIVAIPGFIGLSFTFVISPIVGGIVGGIITVFTTPFFVLATTLLYLRLRTEKGAAESLGISPTPTA